MKQLLKLLIAPQKPVQPRQSNLINRLEPPLGFVPRSDPSFYFYCKR